MANKKEEVWLIKNKSMANKKESTNNSFLNIII